MLMEIIIIHFDIIHYFVNKMIEQIAIQYVKFVVLNQVNEILKEVYVMQGQIINFIIIINYNINVIFSLLFNHFFRNIIQELSCLYLIFSINNLL